MKKIYNYLKMIRVKHYIKNILIFIPLIFSETFFKANIISVVIGFFSFSFMASTIYIINDLNDLESDKKHKTKKYRIIASGKISKKNAIIVACILFSLSLLLNFLATRNLILSYSLLLGYFIINLLYSLLFKQKPLLDIFCLMSFYIIRIYYGASLINVSVSSWLYLTAMSFSFYFVLGKRLGELNNSKETRKVLKYYNINFLQGFMYLMMTCGIVFYALWANNMHNNFIFTIPLLIGILMKYTLDMNESYDSDPTEVLYSDNVLIALCFIYGISVLLLLFFFS